jgi:phage gp29-like protein
MKPVNKLSLELTAQLLPVVQEIEPTIDQITDAGIFEDGIILCMAQAGKSQFGIRIEDGQIEAIALDNTAQFSEPEDPSDPMFTQLNPTAQFSQPKQDTPDQIATNLQKLGDPIVGGWLRQIEQILMTSDDLETARDALFQLYPDLESTELTQQMTDAAAAASLAGFWEAEQDANV